MDNMELKYKADFERAKEMWRHYWAGELLKRPLVVAPVTKKAPKRKYYRYHASVNKDFKTMFEHIENTLENTEYIGEAIPYFSPDLGPDQFAAFLGAELKFSEASKETNWVEAIVEDWSKVLPLRLDEKNHSWQTILEVARRLSEHAKGKYLVGVCDFHSNADTLSALRNPQFLCTDFYDCPELVEKAMLDVRKLYQSVYEKLYQASGMNAETGSIGWLPLWSEGKFACVQCDFMCMVSPEICRKYIIPALEEEAAFLDHCVLHFDGPGALPHLDDVLAIKKIDVLQWTPGAGQPYMYEWTDVLLKAQKAGKGLQIYGVNLDIIRNLSKILNPEGIVYCPDVKTADEAYEIIEWLEKNT